jgi:hypothetical protein
VLPETSTRLTVIVTFFVSDTGSVTVRKSLNAAIGKGSRYLSIMAALTLSGCVMIPYETPEAKAQIAHDLKLSPPDIQGITETNWCLYLYGSEPACTATKGLGVLTRNGLILSLYEAKTYQPVLTLKSEQITCAKTVAGQDAEETFVVFTDKMGVMLAPITPGGQLNMPMKKKFFDYLLARNQTVFTGKDGSYVKETDERRYGGGFVRGTAIPYATSETVWTTINPCPGS